MHGDTSDRGKILNVEALPIGDWKETAGSVVPDLLRVNGPFETLTCPDTNRPSPDGRADSALVPL